MHFAIAVGAPAPRAQGLWRAEFIGTIRLALPIALTQLGQIAMMTSDLVLIGHLGDKAIASAALGQTILFAGFMLDVALVENPVPDGVVGNMAAQ